MVTYTMIHITVYPIWYIPCHISCYILFCMVYNMLYIKIYTIWYIPYGIYHLAYGIYQLKVVYTMTQPSRCNLIMSESPGQGRQRRASEPELNENSNPVPRVPVPKEIMRNWETLFWFVRHLVLTSIFPSTIPIHNRWVDFLMIHTTISTLIWY